MSENHKKDDFAKRLEKAVNAAADRRRVLEQSRPSAAVVADSLTVLGDADTIVTQRADGTAILAKAAAAVVAAGTDATVTAGFGATAQQMLAKVSGLMDQSPAERTAHLATLGEMVDGASRAGGGAWFRAVHMAHSAEAAVVNAIPAMWTKNAGVSPTPQRPAVKPAAARTAPAPAVDLDAILAKALAPLKARIDDLAATVESSPSFLRKGAR